MNLPRVITCGRSFINKFNKPLQIITEMKTEKLTFSHVKFFSSFSNCNKSVEASRLTLTPMNSLIINSRGMKIRGNLQLRCKDCYFERKDGVMYVMCSSYPRHKQRAMLKKPKYSWILTYAFQSKRRPCCFSRAPSFLVEVKLKLDSLVFKSKVLGVNNN